MQIGIAIGAAGVVVGLALMATGQSMCRTSCWIDNFFRLILPERYAFWGHGLPAVVIGIAIIIHAMWGGNKR